MKSCCETMLQSPVGGMIGSTVALNAHAASLGLEVLPYENGRQSAFFLLANMFPFSSCVKFFIFLGRV